MPRESVADSPQAERDTITANEAGQRAQSHASASYIVSLAQNKGLQKDQPHIVYKQRICDTATQHSEIPIFARGRFLTSVMRVSFWRCRRGMFGCAVAYSS